MCSARYLNSVCEKSLFKKTRVSLLPGAAREISRPAAHFGLEAYRPTPDDKRIQTNLCWPAGVFSCTYGARTIFLSTKAASGAGAPPRTMEDGGLCPGKACIGAPTPGG